MNRLWWGILLVVALACAGLAAYFLLQSRSTPVETVEDQAVRQQRQLDGLEALSAEASTTAQQVETQKTQLEGLNALQGFASSTPPSDATSYTPPPPSNEQTQAQQEQLRALESL